MTDVSERKKGVMEQLLRSLEQLKISLGEGKEVQEDVFNELFKFLEKKQGESGL